MTKSGLEKHAAERGSCFSVVTNVEPLRESIKKAMPDFRLWAWIDHEPDDEEGKPHTHFVFTTNGSRTIKMIAQKLEIEPNYVQVVRKITAMYRYLIHADNPEKRQYNLEDIQTNHMVDFKISLQGNNEKDVNSLFLEYTRLCRHELTPRQFIELNYGDLNRLGFAQKIKTFETIVKAYGTT